MKEWHGDDIEEDHIEEEHIIEPDGEEVAATAAAQVAKLKDEIASLRAEKQDYMDGWQRSKADYVNAQKRYESGLKVAETRGVVKAVETLLPAFDALERAKEHGDIPEGFVAIAKQLESAFASLELEAVGERGERFDPALHEAFGQDTTEDVTKDDTVTAVLEKGWKIGEILVRAAKVRIARFANENQEA